MQFFVISIIICYIFFLFYLYKLGKEDFVLIRKNVALEQLFNITFIATIVSFLVARLCYVLSHFNVTYLNPLKFFVLPYFPGLVFPALIVGGYLYIWYKRKLPSGRLIDFYALALASIMPLLALCQLFLPGQQLIVQVVLAIIHFFIYLFFRFLLLPRVNRGEIKDGTLGLLFLAVICTTSFLQDAFTNTHGILFFLQLEDIFYLLVLLIIIVSLYPYEFRQTKKRK
ncbi:MAG TPA: hypothetical protein VMR41_03130 [Patescibacteria group bacterium]|nr:hypothetical protein [Patescibacteria group bacterium]